MSEQLWTNAPEGECTDADIGQTSEVQEWMKMHPVDAAFDADGNIAEDALYRLLDYPQHTIDAVVTSDDWQSDQSYYAREAWAEREDDEDEEGD